MNTRRGIKLAILLLFLGWLTWPSAGQLDIDSCKPNSILSKVSETIYRQHFWTVQAQDIKKRRTFDESWDQRQVEVDAESARLDQLNRA